MQDTTFPRFSAATFPLFVSALFLVSCVTVPVGQGKKDVDFSHYDKPLVDQVTYQIKAEVTDRLGTGKNTYDRYFIIPFAYENKGNHPESSHSFLSVIRVLADDQQPNLTPDLQAPHTFEGREFEAFTISWLPEDFPENPNLCVFDGPGAVANASLNKCPLSVGKSFDLPTTLSLAVSAKVAVGMWGPYEITEEAFNRAVGRLRLLESGALKYRADDRETRKDKVAINCFHAMANLDELYPAGGFLGTGFKMWGLNGTKQVLREYTTKASNQGLLLESVDIENDVIGFVYAPSRGAARTYHPFKRAFVYGK